MKTIKAKVHRLPTDDSMSSPFYVDKSNKIYQWGEDLKASGIPQHLYITTDVVPKFSHPRYNVNGNSLEIWDADDMECLDLVSLKIIATTDPKLHTNKIVEEDMHMYKKSLPQIPKSFIEEYCEAGGIDEVLVEYEERFIENSLKNYKRMLDEVIVIVPKLNSNNCIIIHPVEEKMYSRDEILHKLTIKSLREKFHSQSGMFINKQTSYEIIKWIEENL